MNAISQIYSTPLDFWGVAIYSGEVAALETALTIKEEPTLEEVRGIHHHFGIIEEGLAAEGLDTTFLKRQLHALERIREGKKAKGALRGMASDLRSFPRDIYKETVFRTAEGLGIYFDREHFSDDLERLNKLHHEMQHQSYVGAFPATNLMLRPIVDKLDEFCLLVASIETQRRAMDSIEPCAWIFRLPDTPMQMVFEILGKIEETIKAVQGDFTLQFGHGQIRRLHVPVEFIPDVLEMARLLRQVLLHYKVSNSNPQRDAYDLACLYEGEIRFLVLFYYLLSLPHNQRVLHVYEDVRPYLNRVAEIEMQEGLKISFAELLQMAMEPIVHLWELMLAQCGNEIMRGIDHIVGGDEDLKREYAQYLRANYAKDYSKEFEKWLLGKNQDFQRFSGELKTKLEREIHRLPPVRRAQEHERFFHVWLPKLNLLRLRLLNSMMASEERRKQGERIFALLDRHLRFDHFHVNKALVEALALETLPSFEKVEEALSQSDSEEDYFEGIRGDLLAMQKEERARREAARLARAKPKKQNGSPNGNGRKDFAKPAFYQPPRTVGTREVMGANRFREADMAWARERAEFQELERRERDAGVFQSKMSESTSLLATFEGLFDGREFVDGRTIPTPDEVMMRAMGFEEEFRLAQELPWSEREVTTPIYHRLASFVDELRLNIALLRRHPVGPRPPL